MSATVSKLRKVQLLGCYGDYPAIVLRSIRDAAAKFKVPTASKIGVHLRWNKILDELTVETTSYWEEVQKDIETEQPNWRRNRKVCPTMLAVRDACEACGYDFRMILSTIKAYVTRNEGFHSRLDEIIEDQDRGALAAMLHRDAVDIRRTFDFEDADLAEPMQHCLQTLTTSWLEPITNREDKPWQWDASETLKKVFAKSARIHKPARHVIDRLRRLLQPLLSPTETLADDDRSYGMLSFWLLSGAKVEIGMAERENASTRGFENAKTLETARDLNALSKRTNERTYDKRNLNRP